MVSTENDGYKWEKRMSFSLTAEHIGDRPVHIIGQGSMGSVVASDLLRTLVGTGWSGVVWLHDHDTYESRNRFNQRITERHARESWPKPLAQAELARAIDLERVVIVRSPGALAQAQSDPANAGKILIVTACEKVTSHTKLGGIVICCVDGMPQREEIWKALDHNGDESTVYVDIRLGLFGFRVYVLDPNNDGHAYRYSSPPHFKVVPVQEVRACDAPRPNPAIANGAYCFAIQALVSWCNLENGSPDPVVNYWGVDFDFEFKNGKGPYIESEQWDHPSPELKPDVDPMLAGIVD